MLRPPVVYNGRKGKNVTYMFTATDNSPGSDRDSRLSHVGAERVYDQPTSYVVYPLNLSPFFLLISSSMSRNLLLGFLCLLTLNLPQVLASLLAIDYGSEWIKASLMKPGVPFDVLLNKDSKRKIQSSVAWKNDDRLFGSDAYNLVSHSKPAAYGFPMTNFAQASRFPTDSFNLLKYLQGLPFESEAVSYYATLSAADTVRSSRNTISLRRSDGTEWTVEELVAMQFSYVKELAETVAGEKVTDVIVTVPPFYTQAERDAVVDAIEIAGLRTLALVNDGTAVAINYAMTRTFPEPEIHIIYDAGASAIRTTLVEFSTVESTGKGKPKVHTQVNVLSSGFDRRSGGAELDRRLVKVLVEDFMNKHQVDITKDKRAMSKFRKEANKLKAILSANNEAVSTVCDTSHSVPPDLQSKSFRSRVRSKTSTTVARSSGLNSKPLPAISKSDSLFLFIRV